MTKRALITAAASGIGAIIAREARRAGYEVVISDIDEAAGRALAEAHGLAFVRADLAAEDDIVALVRQVGAVDLLVNNGGIAGPTAPVSEIPTLAWRQVFDVNVTAQFIACREMVPLMRGRGGAIVNMASVAAKIGYPNRAPYAASKWAVLGFTASLAREVAEHGIRVNAILPGSVRGERIMRVIRAYAQANGLSEADATAHYLRRQATGRFVEPEEIAAMVLYLANDAARSITGQFISIDGGFE